MAEMDDKTGFRSITQTLLSRVILVAAFSILAVGLIHGYQAYRSEQARFDHLHESVTANYVPLLGQFLDADESAGIEQQLNVIERDPDIRGVSLVAVSGAAFSVGASATAEPDVVIDIPHPQIPDQSIGTLALAYDRAHIASVVLKSALGGALEFSIFCLLLCLVGYRAILRHVKHPLEQIAGYSQQLSPRRDNPPLVIDRPERNWRDEIDLITEGFDTLRSNIGHFIRERNRITEELAQERDQLDARVRERTDDIRRINNHLEMLSRFSMLMIDHEPSQHRTAMDEAMEELSQKLGASACGIACFKGDEDWRWRFVWRASDSDSAFKSTDALVQVPREPGWFVDNNNLLEDAVLCSYVSDSDGYLLALAGTGRQATEVVEHRLLHMTAEVFFKMIERWQHIEELERSRRELFRLSRTDHLTGLANRRYFDEAKLIEGRRAQRTQSPVSMLMIDVDFFKAYNDFYGHGAGDQCLAQIAGIMSHHCRRAGELPARMGGEEFAILLPEHDAASASELAERVRGAVFDLAIPHAGSPLGQVSISIGCATWVGDRVVKALDAVFEVLMAEADRRLYLAKSGGRNRVVADTEADQPVGWLNQAPDH